MTSNSFQDNHGWSVLHLAVHGRHLDTVGVLLGNSIIPESRLLGDESGLTPGEWLDFEFDSHFYRNISNLAFAKSRCSRAVTILRQAVHNSNNVLTEFLLEQGYDIDRTNSGRRTALYYAARKGNIPILDMLLENGADPNILPAGRRTWEEFIPDDIILQRLRQAGYTKPLPNPEIDDQIRLALCVENLLERSPSLTHPGASSTHTHTHHLANPHPDEARTGKSLHKETKARTGIYSRFQTLRSNSQCFLPTKDGS